MSLQLNVPSIDFKEFYGANNKQMYLLIAEGRTPLSAAGLMKRRLEVLNAPEEVMQAWFGNYFDTGDGAVRNADGKLKIVPDAKYLRILTPKTELVNGAVPLSEEAYRSLPGEEFSKADVDKYFGEALGKADVKRHPGWLALARGDKSLLGDFADVTFAQAKQRFNYDGKMMGVYAPSAGASGALGRLWCVGRLDGYFNLSWASGGSHLGYGGGRLVGVAPEAQRAAVGQLKPTLEQRV